MKQKVSTIMCIVLLALQLNALVTAEESRSVSSDDLAAAVSNGDIIIAEGVLENKDQVPGEGPAVESTTDVFDGDVPAADVSGGDVPVEDVSGGDLPVEDVSGGDALVEDVSGGDALVEDVSGGDALVEDVSGGDAPVEDVSGGDTPVEDVSGGDLPVEDVSGGDAPMGDVSGGDVSGGDELFPEEPIDVNELAVVRLQVPRNLNFVIDPLELCGRGSVWSREYGFCNNGESPVQIKLTDISCSVREGILSVGSQVDRETVLESLEKVIKLQFVLSNGDVVDITKEGTAYETVINPGEVLTLSVSGAVSNPRNDRWQNGDVSLALTYRAVICEE